MNAPLVTIVLPTRDRPVELRRAVRSVLGQTERSLELLVVDDGSATPVGLAPPLGDDPRVRVLRNETSQGVARARNRAISEAQGTWVAFLDDDDFWHERKLELQLAAAERTGATLLFTSALLVNTAGRTVGRFMAPEVTDLPRQLLPLNAVGNPSTVMVRRDLLEAHGRFDPELSILADWDLWLQLAPAARPCALREITVAVVDHPGSMQVVQADETQAELEHMRRKHRALAEAAGAPLGSASTEAWFASKQWRAERSPAAALGYVRGLLRRHGPVGLARLAASRWVRRFTTPRWVRDAFRA